MTRHFLLYALVPLLFAVCPQLAAAGSSSGSDARSMSPTSPSPRTSAPTDTSSSGGHDLNNAPPTAAECDRLARDQSSLNAGGIENADMKAKMAQCEKMRGARPH